MYLNPFIHRHNLHLLILEQIEQAFNNKPSIAGTLHGQRKIFQGCYGRRTALFPSTKCNGSIPVESRLELAHAVSLEQDPNVKDFRTQSLKIQLSSCNFSYPDFLIETYDNNYEVHEVKPLISSLSDKDLERFERLSKIFDSIGIKFRLVDKNTLPSEEGLQRLLYLYQRGHRYPWSPLEIDFALKHLQEHQFETINHVHAALQVIGLKCELAEYLLFHKRITLLFKNSNFSQGDL